MLCLGDVVAFEDMLEQIEISLTDAHSGHPKLKSMIQRKKLEISDYINNRFVHEDDIETYFEDHHYEIMQYCGQGFTFDDMLMELDYVEVCDTTWYVVGGFS